MTKSSPGPSTLDRALSLEAYTELVDQTLLRLAHDFLEDTEVNAALFADRVGGGLPSDSSMTAEPTLDALLSRAAPSGLKLFRLGFSDSLIEVRATNTQSFLRTLLLPAAREVARLKFQGSEEPTTREIWARAQQHMNVGDPDCAAALRIADDDDGPELVDRAGLGVFSGNIFSDVPGAEGFSATDDNERIERRERAERARDELIGLLSQCEIGRKDWLADVADVGAQIDTLIDEGFGVKKNASGALTRAIFDAVEAALSSVGEKSSSVIYGYTGKVMELARLVDARGGSRVDRVRRALNRDKNLAAK